MANVEDEGAASADRGGRGVDESGMDASVMSAMPPQARAFNLKRDAGALTRFTLSFASESEICAGSCALRVCKCARRLWVTFHAHDHACCKVIPAEDVSCLMSPVTTHDVLSA